MVHLRAFVESFPPELQASALLALSQLMAVDAAYCNANIALLFTLLYKRCVCVCVCVCVFRAVDSGRCQRLLLLSAQSPAPVPPALTGPAVPPLHHATQHAHLWGQHNTTQHNTTQTLRTQTRQAGACARARQHGGGAGRPCFALPQRAGTLDGLHVRAPVRCVCILCVQVVGVPVAIVWWHAPCCACALVLQSTVRVAAINTPPQTRRRL
jgi:hypothetical protein